MVINPNMMSNQQLEKLSRIRRQVFKGSENVLSPPNKEKLIETTRQPEFIDEKSAEGGTKRCILRTLQIAV